MLIREKMMYTYEDVIKLYHDVPVLCLYLYWDASVIQYKTISPKSKCLVS